jgi:hypothetical protein
MGGSEGNYFRVKGNGTVVSGKHEVQVKTGSTSNTPTDVEMGTDSLFAGHAEYNLWKTKQELDYTVWISRKEKEYLDFARDKGYGDDITLTKRTLESEYSALKSKQDLSFAVWIQGEIKESEDFSHWKSRQDRDYAKWKSRLEADCEKWKAKRQADYNLTLAVGVCCGKCCFGIPNACCCWTFLAVMIWLLARTLLQDHPDET